MIIYTVIKPEDIDIFCLAARLFFFNRFFAFQLYLSRTVCHSSSFLCIYVLLYKDIRQLFT